jgi:hypothetical protein
MDGARLEERREGGAGAVDDGSDQAGVFYPAWITEPILRACSTLMHRVWLAWKLPWDCACQRDA